MLTEAPLGVEQGVSLAAYNSFRFDYQGEYVAKATSLTLLAELLHWAHKFNLSITIIGGGSNLLLSGDVSGLVIINQLSGISYQEYEHDAILLNVAGGENWHALVEMTVKKGWYGIENLALIPGTAGAAPVQNIGAYGVEVKDCLTRIQVMESNTQKLRWIDAKDCGFAYRDSLFKSQWGKQYVITAIELKLSKTPSFKLQYGGLSGCIEGGPTLQKVFDAVCQVRASKLPDPKKLANAGSFFKNPVVDASTHERLVQLFPDLVAFPFEKGFKLAAGWLIDQAGWKGIEYKGVGVYPKQALVLVNYHDKQADNLLTLQDKIQSSVATKYGVELEREPIRLPNDKEAVQP
ncbi:UDP-N-acetylmuramate dehydrogenase [Marinomonas epiphytica]